MKLFGSKNFSGEIISTLPGNAFVVLDAVIVTVVVSVVIVVASVAVVTVVDVVGVE